MAGPVRVFVDWAKDGTFTAANDDVSTRVLPAGRVTIEYGRDMTSPLSPVTAGSGGLSLKNGDRRFSPRNTASPLFGLVKPARPVKIERTVGTGLGATTYTLGPRTHTDAQPLTPDRDNRTVTLRLVDYLADLRGKPLSTQVYRSLRSGDAVGLILDGVGWTAGRDIDPGVSVFPYWWEESTDALDALDKVLRSEGWPCLAYVDGNGTFVFRDRHHRITDTTSTTVQSTFRASGTEPVMHKDFVTDEGWDGVFNDLGASVPLLRARRLQAVWESDDPIFVPGGEVVALEVLLNDPVVELFAPVQVTPVQDLVQQEIADSTQAYNDNPGTIVTTPGVTNVTATLSRTSGQAMTLTLTNGGTTGEDETVTSIALFGRPVTSTASVQVSASDATSIADYGARDLPNTDLPWCSRYDAKRILDSILAQRKDPLTQVVCTFKVGRTAAGQPSASDLRARAILARALGDRVRVVEPESQIDGDFYVERIAHDLDGDIDHTVTLWLEEVPPTVAPALASLFTFDVNTAGRRFDSGLFG